MVEAGDFESFGALLSRRMREIGKKPRHIRRELGVGYSTVDYWHSGVRLPDKDRLSAIAEAYRIPLDELISAYELAYRARRAEKESRKPARLGRLNRFEQAVEPFGRHRE